MDEKFKGHLEDLNPHKDIVYGKFCNIIQVAQEKRRPEFQPIELRKRESELIGLIECFDVMSVEK